ncbi:MAG: hypothetical protein ACK4GQ_02090 [Candidatus Hadarchaeales archaeon]
MIKIKQFKIGRCKFRSFLNPFRLKLEIGKYRIHHGYIGSAMTTIGASWGMFGNAGTATTPLWTCGLALFFDDLIAHLRNKLLYHRKD